jgi:hypothetical protein
MNELEQQQPTPVGEDRRRGHEGRRFRRQRDHRVRRNPRRRPDGSQKQKLLDVVEVFAQRGKADVARARMAEIRTHLSGTYAAWIGGTLPAPPALGGAHPERQRLRP